jgi:hypothetical protein
MHFKLDKRHTAKRRVSLEDSRTKTNNNYLQLSMMQKRIIKTETVEADVDIQLYPDRDVSVTMRQSWPLWRLM